MKKPTFKELKAMGAPAITLDPEKRIEVICYQILPGVMSEYLNGKYSREYAIDSLDRNTAAAARLQARIPDGDKYDSMISDCYRKCLRMLGF